MSKLNFNKHDVSRALLNKLDLRFRSGKERNGWYELDGKKILRVTMPKGRGAIPPGTLNSIRDQTFLSRNDFADLIRCPLSGSDYARIIREKIDVGLL